jgi:hypothetical protein
MCARHEHQPGRQSPRNFIMNWNQTLPLRVKISKTGKNLSIHVIKRQTCCGHDGELGR